MTDVTYYNFDLRDGLPPEEPDRSFFGFDEEGHPYVLRWNSAVKAWVAVGFTQRNHGWVPVSHTLIEESSGRITRWAPAPLPWSEVTTDEATT